MTSGAEIPHADFSTLPAHLYGLLDMCSAIREVPVEDPILVYYKYSSANVDCIKWFHAKDAVRKLAFRMLVSNLPQAHDESVRPDALHFYYDKKLDKDHYLGTIRMREVIKRLFQVQSTMKVINSRL